VELYPAVDVQGGRVARAPAAHADPLAALERYARAGARWVHFVDLDRAYGRGANDDVTRACLRAAPPTMRVQVGGGVSTEAGVEELLSWGAARVVLGAAAATDAPLVDRLLARYGVQRLAVGIDARDGKLAPRGGAQGAPPIVARDLARRLRAQGARTVVYADVARDGTLGGPDLAGARILANGTHGAEGADGLEVIVSGGIATLDDLRATRAAGLAGAIVGRALHEAKFTLAEALACVA
jgi:phosphoribosylformimino-5-aminoimidazole carboxamide ribotide isomerase